MGVSTARGRSAGGHERTSDNCKRLSVKHGRLYDEERGRKRGLQLVRPATTCTSPPPRSVPSPHSLTLPLCAGEAPL